MRAALGDGALELIGLLEQQRAQASQPGDLRPARGRPGRINRLTRLVYGSPAADDIEILERKSQRVDDRMTTRARGIPAVLREAFASVSGAAPGLASVNVVSTPGGGGGIGSPKMLFNSHLPRSTGEVRSG